MTTFPLTPNFEKWGEYPCPLCGKTVKWGKHKAIVKMKMSDQAEPVCAGCQKRYKLPKV